MFVCLCVYRKYLILDHVRIRRFSYIMYQYHMLSEKSQNNVNQHNNQLELRPLIGFLFSLRG
jgi:hypothetical protein